LKLDPYSVQSAIKNVAQESSFGEYHLWQHSKRLPRTSSSHPEFRQVAQLSQRDRAAGWLVLAKSGRLELGDNILRKLYVCLQP